MQESSLLEMRHINKFFPGVKALHNVDFTLRKGEIHALMGENGAGKSTLIKVLTGVYASDGGEITVDGKKVQIRSPQDAQNNGISTVYQEISLCPNLTVAENMFIGREKGSLIRRKDYQLTALDKQFITELTKSRRECLPDRGADSREISAFLPPCGGMAFLYRYSDIDMYISHIPFW